MVYREPNADRAFVCRHCGAVGSGPWRGGEVTCSACAKPQSLLDRTTNGPKAGAPTPTDDPARLALLHRQAGQLRAPSATLIAVLGGPSIRPGGEAEAQAVWQSLRARAESQDVGASEDLTILTSILVQHPSVDARRGVALAESAVDAVVLPRHRQEMLGWLARQAIASGDRGRAETSLASMVRTPDDLESDSELRIGLALLATAKDDPSRVVALLGTGRNAIPVAQSLLDLATVLRANAVEKRGDAPGAVEVLRELSRPHLLDAVRTRYPSLDLCTASGPTYSASRRVEASRAAAKSAGGLVWLFGLFTLLGLGCFALFVACVVGAVESEDAWSYPLVGALLWVLGVPGVYLTRHAAKHAAWLQSEGLSLEARVIDVGTTGNAVGDIPVMRLSLEVAGPKGAYRAACSAVLSEVRAAALVGSTVRVRVAPNQPQDVALEG